MVRKQGKEGLRVPSSELGFLRIWVPHPKHIQISLRFRGSVAITFGL